MHPNALFSEMQLAVFAVLGVSHEAIKRVGLKNLRTSSSLGRREVGTYPRPRVCQATEVLSDSTW